MRVLHVTDTHLGLTGARGALATLAARALKHALVPAFSGRVDAVLHTGDLFDRSEAPEAAARFARETLTALARVVPVVVLAGNHDRRGVARALGPLPPGLRVVDVPQVLTLGSLQVGCLPHTHDAAVWREQAIDLARRGVDFLACHQSFHGQRVPGFTFRAGRPAETVGEIPLGVRWVASGHLHPRQRVHVGDAEVVCPGSAIRTSFGEGDAPKGYAIWTFERTVSCRFEDLPSPDWVWVRARDDLDRVVDGAVVRAGSAELAEAARNRGATVLGSALPRQASLF